MQIKTLGYPEAPFPCAPPGHPAGPSSGAPRAGGCRAGLPERPVSARPPAGRRSGHQGAGRRRNRPCAGRGRGDAGARSRDRAPRPRRRRHAAPAGARHLQVSHARAPDAAPCASRGAGAREPCAPGRRRRRPRGTRRPRALRRSGRLSGLGPSTVLQKRRAAWGAPVLQTETPRAPEGHELTRDPVAAGLPLLSPDRLRAFLLGTKTESRTHPFSACRVPGQVLSTRAGKRGWTQTRDRCWGQSVQVAAGTRRHGVARLPGAGEAAPCRRVGATLRGGEKGAAAPGGGPGAVQVRAEASQGPWSLPGPGRDGPGEAVWTGFHSAALPPSASVK